MPSIPFLSKIVSDLSLGLLLTASFLQNITMPHTRFSSSEEEDFIRGSSSQRRAVSQQTQPDNRSASRDPTRVVTPGTSNRQPPGAGQQAQPGNNNMSTPSTSRRPGAFANLSYRERQFGQTSSGGSREQARAPAPVSTKTSPAETSPTPVRRQSRVLTPPVSGPRASTTPSRPVNSNPTTPAIDAKRHKRPRYNTKERARKCISCTGMGRICTWSEDSTGKALPRCDDCTDRNKKCKDIPFSTEILDRYLDALADKSPATDAAPISGPRFQFLQAVKRHTTAVNKAAKEDNRSTAPVAQGSKDSRRRTGSPRTMSASVRDRHESDRQRPVARSSLASSSSRGAMVRGFRPNRGDNNSNPRERGDSPRVVIPARQTAPARQATPPPSERTRYGSLKRFLPKKK
jgi:hypothetical protein